MRAQDDGRRLVMSKKKLVAGNLKPGPMLENWRGWC